MDSQSILILAKQGDANAIATLINNSLEGKRIIAKVARKDDCLQIILESPEVPSQESLVSIIRKGLMSLAPESISHIKIYARQSEGGHVVWSERFSLTATEAPRMPDFSPPISGAIMTNPQNASGQKDGLIVVILLIVASFGACSIFQGSSGSRSESRDECYQRVQQELVERQGDKKLTDYDIQYAYVDFVRQCERGKR